MPSKPTNDPRPNINPDPPLRWEAPAFKIFTTHPSGTKVNLDDLPDSCLLDAIDAATALDVSPGTLSVWRCTGRYALPYVKCGRKVRYKVADLRAFLARRTRSHTGQEAA